VQVLHRDDGKYPIARPHQELIVNTMWALDDFTPTNGATVLLPRSHQARTDGGRPVLIGGGGSAEQAAAAAAAAADLDTAAREQRGRAALLTGGGSTGGGSTGGGSGPMSKGHPRRQQEGLVTASMPKGRSAPPHRAPDFSSAHMHAVWRRPPPAHAALTG
jgi:hypothetical protein